MRETPLHTFPSNRNWTNQTNLIHFAGHEQYSHAVQLEGLCLMEPVEQLAASKMPSMHSVSDTNKIN
jgi:hypothetical protein